MTTCFARCCADCRPGTWQQASTGGRRWRARPLQNVAEAGGNVYKCPDLESKPTVSVAEAWAGVSRGRLAWAGATAANSHTPRPHKLHRCSSPRLPACALALRAAACASRRLSLLAAEDSFWQQLLLERVPRVAALLEGAPAQAQPEWWAGRSWRQRLRALAGGATFQAQVFNRELENEAEDFLLSTYDATCWLSPASARSLLEGGSGSSTHASGSCSSTHASGSSGDGPDGGGGGGRSTGSESSSSSSNLHSSSSGSSSGSTYQQHQPAELLFTARYLPMGTMAAVEEADVPAARLRLPPPASSPFAVYADTSRCGGRARGRGRGTPGPAVGRSSCCGWLAGTWHLSVW